MRHLRFAKVGLLCIFASLFSGCSLSGYVAKRLVQPPNQQRQFPAVLASFDQIITNAFDSEETVMLSNRTRIAYQVFEPGDYQLKLESGLETNSIGFNLSFQKPENYSEPKATIVLLHGYFLDRRSMIPWGLYFAQNGYRSVVVDLRGHGHSSGDTVTFGQEERYELKELLTTLTSDKTVEGAVGVFGFSYGAAMAIQWASIDPRVQSIVSASPYNDPTDAILTLAKKFAPKFLSERSVRKGIVKAEKQHGIHWDDLLTEDFIERTGPPIFFVRGGLDTVCTPAVERVLMSKAPVGSRGLQIAGVPHEVVGFVFHDLKKPTLKWFDETLDSENGPGSTNGH